MTKIPKALEQMLIIGIISLCLSGHTFAAQNYNPEIAPYVEYIGGIKQTSVEYVIRLFDTYDVAILGERSHKDITQYEFILNLVKHPKFVEKIGHIFTEIGSQSQQPRIEMGCCVFSHEEVGCGFFLFRQSLWKRSI